MRFLKTVNTPETPTQKILEGDFCERIMDSSKTCSFAKAKRRMRKWKKEGKFTIFQAGTFDLLTINHILGLINSRVIGAMNFLGIESIENEKDCRLVHEIAASDRLRLMITLDSDQRLKKNKSWNFKKGNCSRPILSWKTRAAMLAMQSIPDVDYQKRVNLVDYITKHGSGCCLVCAEGKCINNNNSRMAVELRPDLLIVNSQSENTLREISDYKKKGRLVSTRVVIIDEKENQYFDKVLNAPVKTTTIINQIRV